MGITEFGTTGRKESRVTQSPGQEPGGGWAGEADLRASTDQSQPAPGTGSIPGGKEPRGRAGGQGCSGEDPGRAQEERRSSRGKEPTSPLGKPGKQRKDDIAREDGEGDLGLTVDSSSSTTSFYIISNLQHIQYITPTSPSLQPLLAWTTSHREGRRVGSLDMLTWKRSPELRI